MHNPDRTRPAVADEFDLDLHTRLQRQPITDRLGNDDPPRAIDGSFHAAADPNSNSSSWTDRTVRNSHPRETHRWVYG